MENHYFYLIGDIIHLQMVGFFPALRRLEVPDAYDAYNAYDAYDAVAREAPKRRSALLERTLKKQQ